MKTISSRTGWTKSWTVLPVGFALVAFAGLWLPLTVHSATRLSPGTEDVIIPEPHFLLFDHHSFVRHGGDGKMLRDFEYAEQVAAAAGATSANCTNNIAVDIVMQQCFGGGFLDDITETLCGPYSFASASLWSETALIVGDGQFELLPTGVYFAWICTNGATPHICLCTNELGQVYRCANGGAFLCAVPRWGGVRTRLDRMDCFTRAWRQDSWDNKTSLLGGMMRHFLTAATGLDADAPPGFENPRILAEPFARETLDPLIQPGTETPQYASSGPSSDYRDLVVGPGKRYAILVNWNESDLLDEACIAGMYRSLTALGVPAANIAILTDTGKLDREPVSVVVLDTNKPPCVATDAGGTVREDGPTPEIGPAVGPTDLGGLPTSDITVNGRNTRNNWAQTLQGLAFKNAPTNGDALFIYNCGHGGHLIRLPCLGEFENIPDSNGSTNEGRFWTNFWVIPRVSTNGDEYFNGLHKPGLLTGWDSNDVCRLYFDRSLLPYQAPFSRQLSPTVSIAINGQSLASPDGSAFAPDPQPLTLDPEVQTSNTVVYTFTVPHSIWEIDTNITIAIWDAASWLTNLCNLLVAVDLAGGKQEFAAVNRNSPIWSGGGGSGTNAPQHVAMRIGQGPGQNSFNLSWPAITNGNGIAVQFTHALKPPVSWLFLSNPILDFGGGRSGLTVYATNQPSTNTFYRLIGP